MERRVSLIAGSVAALLAAGAARGQVGVLYSIQPGSTLTAEHCLPPCLCPSGSVTGPLEGTFTLTRIKQGPAWTEYSVTGIDWRASLALQPTPILGQGVYRIGGEVVPTHELNLQLVVLDSPISDPSPFFSGQVAVDLQHPFPEIAIVTIGEKLPCRRYTVSLIAAPAACQADCDGSGQLTANDFMCFLNKFVAGDPYANCDGSTGVPRLTANDFQCHLNRYAQGCQ